MTKDIWEYRTENIKKFVSDKGKQIMVININYPVFDGDSSFAVKINRFYRHTAEKYSDYISKKYPQKALRIFESNGNVKLSFLMNCTVSYNGHGIISVFSDLSYFDGKKKKTARFSQNWKTEKSAILPSSYCFETKRKAKQYITELITEIASDNIKSRNFSYYSDFERILAKKFNFDNVYFVPNGTAFFYNAGVLSDDDVPCVFVIPNEKIDGILKISVE